MWDKLANKVSIHPHNPSEGLNLEWLKPLNDGSIRDKLHALLEDAGVKNGGVRFYSKKWMIQIDLLEENSTNPITSIILQGEVHYKWLGKNIDFNDNARIIVWEAVKDYLDNRNNLKKNTQQQLVALESEITPSA